MTVVGPPIGVGADADPQRLLDERLRLAAARLADDPAAFEDLYALLAPGTLRLLRRLVPAADAEDVLQNTFADVWRDRAGYDPQRSVRGWVTGIARHRCADLLRSRTPQPVGGLDEADSLELFATAMTGPGSSGGDAVAEQVVRNRLVLGALRSVSVEQREVLALAYFRDLTQPEIADWLDVPLGTVKARAARGLRALATALRGGPPDPDSEVRAP